MKKKIAIVMIVSIILSMCTCFAENNTTLFEAYMEGTWLVNEVSLIHRDNLFNYGSVAKQITFPYSEFFVTGDETGKVYIFGNNGFAYLRSEVTFSSDFMTMVLIDTDGSRIVLQKVSN